MILLDLWHQGSSRDPLLHFIDSCSEKLLKRAQFKVTPTQLVSWTIFEERRLASLLFSRQTLRDIYILALLQVEHRQLSLMFCT